MTTAFGDGRVCGGASDRAFCGARNVALLAAAGAAVEPVRLGDRRVGMAFEDDAARYCVLSGLRSGDPDRSAPGQAAEVFETMEAGLAAAGMDFTHVIRTWFYLKDILGWYDAFNRVRTGFFAQRRVFDGVVPASTGVGMSTPEGTAVVGELLAMRPKRADVRVVGVASPRQCCAREYGSSFSRAVEVSLPGQDGARGLRRLYVSGTASIDATGRTLHADDVRRQVAETMEVVRAILESRGMGWADVVSGVAYFAKLDDAPLLAAYAREHELSALPLAVVRGDICRGGLLFEVEVEAWKRE